MILDGFRGRTLDEIKRDEQALVAVLEAGGCKIKGRTVRCGFCNDHKPSGGIYNGDGNYRYKCQSCGRQGSIVDVISWVDNISDKDVLMVLSNKSQTEYVPKEQRAKKPKVYSDLAKVRAVMPGKIVFEHTYFDRTSKKILLIVFRCEISDGKTYRQVSPTTGGYALQAPAKPWPIYNLPQVFKTDTVIIVEGEKTADALIKLGYAATTTPSGAGKAEHADLSPLTGKTVYIWPDNDAKGLAHAEDLRERLLKLGCKVFIVRPETIGLAEKQDAYDFIDFWEKQKLSADDIKIEVQQVLDNAEPCRISGGLLKLINDTEAGRRESISLPFERLGFLSRPLLPGTLLLLCGAPGSGKSFFVMQCLLHWLATSVKFACYMLEEDRDYHLHRALAMLESNANLLDPDWLRDNAGQAKQAYNQHAEVLDQLGACLWAEPEKQLNYLELTKWVEDRAKSGCRVICIDPVTAAEQNDKPWIADTQFLMAVKKIAVDYGVSVVLVTHPKKGKTAPGLDDLAGGAAFQRFAQAIYWLELHKQPIESKVKTNCGVIEIDFNRSLHICKSRNGRGHGLSLAFKFRGESLLFGEQGVIVK